MGPTTRWLIVGMLVWLANSAAAQQTNDSNVRSASSATPTDISGAADAAVLKMRTSSTRVRHLLDDARRNKDVVKATCLSDRLVQIEVAIKGAEERKLGMKSAVSRGDNALRDHEYSVLTVLRQRVEQLDAEANMCVGEDIGFPGETTRTLQVNPSIADYDPTSNTSTPTASGNLDQPSSQLPTDVTPPNETSPIN